MNIAPFIFIGLFATFSLSWFGYVFKPQADLGKQEPYADPITGAVYPIPRDGLAMQGAEVYRAQGCAACHTQQVRDKSEGNDTERGWGFRKTVASDYMLENPPQLGSVRLGPDLANVGLRKGTNDVQWHYKHLFNPKSVVEKSNMPPYPYLFEGDATRPTAEAKALVAYLISLKTVGSVFEAPMPVSTNAPAGGTNAPAAGTNAAPATNAAAGAPTTNSAPK
jgi:cytochrome c oxidase cbb3-type subunit II